MVPSFAVPKPAMAASVEKRLRGASENPLAADGMQADSFATGLGTISAMALLPDGTIFVSDKDKGRVYRLSDRRKDGRLDAISVFSQGLDNPTGLALIDDTLYVADNQAIWAQPVRGGYRKVLAKLGNLPLSDVPRGLWPAQDKASVLISISDPNGSARIVSVDLKSGTPNLLAQGAGPVSAIAQTPTSDLWIAAGAYIVPVRHAAWSIEDGFEITANATIDGLLLPGQFPAHPKSFLPWADHVLVSIGPKGQGNMKRALSVMAVPTSFGKPTEGRKTFLHGFKSENRLSGWGSPAAMVMDERGVFVADQWSGTVWRLGDIEVQTDDPQLSERIFRIEEPRPKDPVLPSHKDTDDKVNAIVQKLRPAKQP